MPTPIDPTTACSLLSDPDRRRLLELFRDVRVWSITDLAAELAASDSDACPEAEAIHRMQIELVHNHLPRLADHGVIEWDGRSGDVVRSDGYEAIESMRDATVADEEQSPVTISDGI